MARAYTCPFFHKGPEQLRKSELRCEGGKVRFPSKCAEKKFIREHCASKSFGKNCSINKMLKEDYEKNER